MSGRLQNGRHLYTSIIEVHTHIRVVQACLEFLRSSIQLRWIVAAVAGVAVGPRWLVAALVRLGA